MTEVYYNEHDPETAAWLRELIRRDLIAPGDVDERDIRDVVPEELVGYRQCHFFAGIGVWSYALRRAGWDDSQPVWTGSCPCQPFSTAGKGAGLADERHLWPSWFHLIGQCKPGVILGEQVASGDAAPWIDLVHTDLEALGYAFGPIVLPAAGFGAPHGRHRIFFVADSDGSGQRPNRRGVRDERDDVGGSGPIGPVNGFWAGAGWLPCRNGKARPAQPGIQPLVVGVASRVVRGGNRGPSLNADATAEARVMRLKGYGNAIVAPVAESFIKAYMEIRS